MARALVWKLGKRAAIPARKGVAILVLVGLNLAALWVATSSFTEPRVQLYLTRALGIGPIQYRVVLESIDEDSGRVQALAQVIPNSHGILTVQKELGVPQDVFDQEVRVLYGDFLFSDLGEKFSLLGLWGVQLTDVPLRPMQKGELPSFDGYKQELPPPARSELAALGNPRLFPFDKYLILGQMSCTAFAGIPGKKGLMITGDAYEIESRVPGFVVRSASGEELETWRIPLPEITKGVNYSFDSWRHSRFAVVLERPRFLQLLTVFLAVVALSSLIYVGFTTESRQFFLSAVGYFLALWAVREVLSVGAPKTHTLIDYGVLVLYTALVSLILARVIWPGKPTTARTPPPASS